MPKISIFPVRDFTGGLNLRENQFQLGKNETPDCMNVDMDARGGFRQRDGVEYVGSARGATTGTMFERTSAAAQLVTADGTDIKYRTGGTWTSIATYAGTVRFTVFKDRLYANNGVAAAKRWNGSAAVTLGTSFNDDISTPTASGSTGNMPIGAVLASHMGSAWVANTVESGTSYPNRVRWSHPNFPEDWHSAHYIDVDEGVDGDYITALVPVGDHLLVFKNRSVHAIYGAPPEELQVASVNQAIGTPSQEAVIDSDSGLYFFSWPDGLFRYNGKQFEWLFENLYPLVQDGLIADNTQDKIRVGYGNRKVWVGICYDGSSTRNRTLVYDPLASKGGTWTQYDLSLGPFITWNPSGEDNELYAYSQTGGILVRTDVSGVANDDFGSGAVHIESWYTTPWYDLGEHGYKKRWKRPEVVLRGGVEAIIVVEAYKDYDRRGASRTFQLGASNDEEAGVWGDDWGEMVWAGNEGVRNEVQRGSALGTCLAVSLKFRGPLTNVPWGVDAVSFKFVPRKVRS